jgi:hypothetical protein
MMLSAIFFKFFYILFILFLLIYYLDLVVK